MQRTTVFLCLLSIGLVFSGSVRGQSLDDYGDPLPNGAVDRLGTQRMRYNIEDIAYDRGGERALVISDRELHAWTLADGERAGSWRVGEHDLQTLDLTDDRSTALLSDEAGVIYEWDVESEEAVGRFATSEDDEPREFVSVRYGPEEDRILTLDDDNDLLQVWQQGSGERIFELKLPDQTDYREAIWGPEGTTAFVGKSPHPNVVRYDLETGEQIVQLLENYIVYDIDLSPDGSALLIGSRLTASEWDTETHEQLHEIGWRVHSGYAVPAAAYAEGGDVVITGSRDGSLRLWDASREEVTMHWFPHQDEVEMIRVSPDGRWVLSYGDDGLLTETSMETGERRLDWPRHFATVNAVASTPEGERYFTGSTDGTIRVWDGSSGEAVTRIENPGGQVHALAVNDEGTRLAVGSEDGSARIIEVAGGDVRQTLDAHVGYVRSLAFVEDEELLTAADDGSLKLWDLEEGRLVHRLGGELGDGHRGGVLDVALVPGKAQALSSGRDGTIRLWDLDSGKQIRAIMAHRGKAESVDVSSDGATAVSAGADGVLVEWNLEEGSVVREIDHGAYVNAVMYLPNGKGIVSADDNGIVKRWSPAGELTAEWTGHRDEVKTLTVDPAANRLLTGSEDTTVLVWGL